MNGKDRGKNGQERTVKLNEGQCQGGSGGLGLIDGQRENKDIETLVKKMVLVMILEPKRLECFVLNKNSVFSSFFSKVYEKQCCLDPTEFNCMYKKRFIIILLIRMTAIYCLKQHEGEFIFGEMISVFHF